jgi:hypothetical protein
VRFALPTVIGRRQAARDQVREQRLGRIIAIADRFVHDLALLSAGHPVDLESYVAPSAAQAIRGRVRPFLESGDLLRPDFGIHGELLVQGDLLRVDRPVDATLEFHDCSVRETMQGGIVPVPRRRVRIRMSVSLHPERLTVVELTTSS